MDEILGVFLMVIVGFALIAFGHWMGVKDSFGDATNNKTFTYKNKVYTVTLDSNATLKLLWKGEK